MSTTVTAAASSDAARAYDVLAPVYDLLTSDYAHERWVDGLERLAREHGLTGRRLLDVGCGTGKSFLPFLRRGYDVTACDVSPEMAARAHDAALELGAAAVHVADARRLPVLGRFDLVTCLLDVLNHLIEPDEVRDALEGIAANLVPGGLVVFDLNTLAAYRDVPTEVVQDDDRMVLWHGPPAEIDTPGGVAEVVVDVFLREDGDRWQRSVSRQLHRHHPLETVHELVEAAGLDVVAVRGQRQGGVLEAQLDEERQHKLVVVARRP